VALFVAWGNQLKPHPPFHPVGRKDVPITIIVAALTLETISTMWPEISKSNLESM
jgi:hypothetical protein